MHDQDSGSSHFHCTHFQLYIENQAGHVICGVGLQLLGLAPAFLHSLSSISFHSESIHLAIFLTEAAVSGSHSQFKSF